MLTESVFWSVWALNSDEIKIYIKIQQKYMLTDLF